MIKLLLMFLPFYLYPPEGREMTDRLIPQGYQGNYWGPEACRARREGTMPPIEITPHMARWDQWGRKVLQDGDIVFRLGDARVLRGFFPMSRFYAIAATVNSPTRGSWPSRKGGPWFTTRPAAASRVSRSAYGSSTTSATSASSGFAPRIARPFPRFWPIAAKSSWNNHPLTTSSAWTTRHFTVWK